jgi:mono/diheme cytochrome c family protein
MNKKAVVLVALFGVIGGAGFWVLSAPMGRTAVTLPVGYKGDVANGKNMYDAGGCISCHKPAKGKGDANLPSGGAPFVTPVGTFYPPNLTPHETSMIGKYRSATGVNTLAQRQFVLAMKYGEGSGGHYIPAFPYVSYAHMKTTDLLDLLAYLQSLKPVDSSGNKTTAIFALPVIRRAMGIWKRFGLDSTDFEPDAGKPASWNRGAYLVAGPGHCNECHTPRTLLMASDFSRHLAGGPHPDGKGKVPSLRGLKKRKRFKSVKDLNSALRFGEVFGYEDMSSGGMGEVQSNMAKLPETDTMAIAEYLFSLE